MSGDRAVCIVGAMVFGALLVLPSTPEPAPIIQPDSYQQAEHFGCSEVAKVCRIKHRMTSVTERKHVAGR